MTWLTETTQLGDFTTLHSHVRTFKPNIPKWVYRVYIISSKTAHTPYFYPTTV